MKCPNCNCELKLVKGKVLDESVINEIKEIHQEIKECIDKDFASSQEGVKDE